ncbi:unnamed protein product [Sphagnum troendelagicum]|uniref:Zinc/iron permease n=1 Tax=Sphagnum troendelagicum TaxID=128251 RepID=A0ABP0U159_9BRYO
MSTTSSALWFLFCFFLCGWSCLDDGARGVEDENRRQAAQSSASSAPNPLRAKSLILVKAYCLIIVFFATMAGGLSPYFLRWNHSFLVLGTQFAGGVFLGTAMIHFLGDSSSTFQSLTTNPYAFAEMLAVAGYFLTMAGDVAIQHVYSSGMQVTTKSASSNGKGDPEAAAAAVAPLPKAKVTILHGTSVGDTILLILALCIHSVFEGIAIGVSDTAADAWKALWTISLHKIFAAIAMGIALLRMLPNRPLFTCTLYTFLFSISTPIGIAVGIIIDSTTEGLIADWIYAISMGIATGVFVYVAVNHLIAKGYVPPHEVWANRPIFKFLAALLGAAVLAVAMIWDT